MFGLFRSKTERKVLKLERMMIAMESAAQANDLQALHRYTAQQTNILRWLHMDGSWSEEEVMSFLEKRGLVTSLTDQATQDMMATKVPEAERLYGIIG